MAVKVAQTLTVPVAGVGIELLQEDPLVATITPFTVTLLIWNPVLAVTDTGTVPVVVKVLLRLPLVDVWLTMFGDVMDPPPDLTQVLSVQAWAETGSKSDTLTRRRASRLRGDVLDPVQRATVLCK
jgi:hypothetical protein